MLVMMAINLVFKGVAIALHVHNSFPNTSNQLYTQHFITFITSCIHGNLLICVCACVHVQCVCACVHVQCVCMCTCAVCVHVYMCSVCACVHVQCVCVCMCTCACRLPV